MVRHISPLVARRKRASLCHYLQEQAPKRGLGPCSGPRKNRAIGSGSQESRLSICRDSQTLNSEEQSRYTVKRGESLSPYIEASKAISGIDNALFLAALA